MLHCTDSTLYTGITTDMTRRFAQHKGEIKGGAKYTRAHPPLSIACTWETPIYSDARRFEAGIKRLKRPQKLALIAAPDTWHAFLSDLHFEDPDAIYVTRREDNA